MRKLYPSTCPQCGKYENTPYKYRVFCSKSCFYKNKTGVALPRTNKVYSHICPGCGAEFTNDRKHQSHCSHACCKRDPFEDRFFARVNKTEGCWLWSGSLNAAGYGQFSSSSIEGYRSTLAHRVSYIIAKGPIPTDLLLRHTCDTPACVNPDHLIPGTPSDNALDMVSRGRQATGEKLGHSKLTEQSVREIRTLYREGNLNLAQIGERYNVINTTIWHVVHNKTWRHVV
jgi:HNH endonuclease